MRSSHASLTIEKEARALAHPLPRLLRLRLGGVLLPLVGRHLANDKRAGLDLLIDQGELCLPLFFLSFVHCLHLDCMTS